MDNDIQNLWDDIKWCRLQLKRMTIDHALRGLGIADDSERVAQLEGFIAGSLDPALANDHKHTAQICDQIIKAFRKAWPDVQSAWTEAPKIWMVAALKACISQVDKGLALPRKYQDSACVAAGCVNCQALIADGWRESDTSQTYTANDWDAQIDKVTTNTTAPKHSQGIGAGGEHICQGHWGQCFHQEDKQHDSAVDYPAPFWPETVHDSAHVSYTQHRGWSDAKGTLDCTDSTDNRGWHGQTWGQTSPRGPGFAPWPSNAYSPRHRAPLPRTPITKNDWGGGRRNDWGWDNSRDRQYSPETMRHMYSVSPPPREPISFSRDANIDPFGSHEPDRPKKRTSQPSPLPRPHDPDLTRRRSLLRRGSRSQLTNSTRIQLASFKGDEKPLHTSENELQDAMRRGSGTSVKTNNGTGRIWTPYASSSILADKSVGDDDKDLDEVIEAPKHFDLSEPLSSLW